LAELKKHSQNLKNTSENSSTLLTQSLPSQTTTAPHAKINSKCKMVHFTKMASLFTGLAYSAPNSQQILVGVSKSGHCQPPPNYMCDNETGAQKFRCFHRQRHNRVRMLHDTQSMEQSSYLDTEAQNWADHLANVDKQVHAPWADRNEQGENLYQYQTSKKYNTDAEREAFALSKAAQSVQSWYDKIQYYSYASPNGPWDHWGVGFFTQVVWDTSVELGVGYKVYTVGFE
jgi:hypothetical protein